MFPDFRLTLLQPVKHHIIVFLLILEMLVSNEHSAAHRIKTQLNIIGNLLKSSGYLLLLGQRLLIGFYLPYSIV